MAVPAVSVDLPVATRGAHAYRGRWIQPFRTTAVPWCAAASSPHVCVRRAYVASARRDAVDDSAACASPVAERGQDDRPLTEHARTAAAAGVHDGRADAATDKASAAEDADKASAAEDADKDNAAEDAGEDNAAEDAGEDNAAEDDEEAAQRGIRTPATSRKRCARHIVKVTRGHHHPDGARCGAECEAECEAERRVVPCAWPWCGGSRSLRACQPTWHGLAGAWAGAGGR